MQAAEGLRQSFREALKSGELRITRDDHIDPISGSLFAIVEQDFLDWLNRQVTPLAARKPPDRERARRAAIELWGTAGPPDHLSNSSISTTRLLSGVYD